MDRIQAENLETKSWRLISVATKGKSAQQSVLQGWG